VRSISVNWEGSLVASKVQDEPKPASTGINCSSRQLSRSTKGKVVPLITEGEVRRTELRNGASKHLPNCLYIGPAQYNAWIVVLAADAIGRRT
jgi:hypothetical protein